jgi:hypothetical protein
MSAFVWIAFYFYYERHKIKSIFFYLISFLFHSLALVFYPLQFLTLRKINFKFSIGLLFVLFVLGESLKDVFLFLNVFISQYNNKLSYYLNDFYGDEIGRYKFGLGFFLYVIIYFLILKYESFFEDKKQIIFFNRLLFLGIATIIFFASVSIFSERIASVFLMSMIFIFASFDRIRVKPMYRVMFLLLLITINVFYLIKILLIPGFDRIYQFTPYTFTLF